MDRFPGAAVVVARRGTVGPVLTTGDSVRYDETGAPCAPVPVTPETCYDLASITKLFTAVLLLRLGVDLSRPARHWLPDLACTATVSEMLTHTAGYPPWDEAVRAAPDPPAARRVAVACAPVAAPGTRHVYSDVGPVIAGFVAERAGGARLDLLVRDLVTGPLGLAATGYRPASPDLCAGSEAGRPRGRVHDETAAALGGVAGHAGLFGTAGDVVRFGEWLRTSYDPRVLVAADGYGQGLAVRVGAPSFMGPLVDSPAFGHTGFTGTSVVVDPVRELTVVLLTNRIHPHRNGPSIDPVRQAVCAAALHSDDSLAAIVDNGFRDVPGE